MIIDTILAVVLILTSLPMFFIAVGKRSWNFSLGWCVCSYTSIWAGNILFPQMEMTFLGLFLVGSAAIGGRIFAADVRLG